MRRAVKALLVWTLCAPAFASSAPKTELRAGFIECGDAHITARAQCFEKTDFCVTQTLSFSRRTGRLIVPLHSFYEEQEVAGSKVKYIEFHADSWACLPGKFGGQYLVVVMSRSSGGNCRECEYSRLYDLNGRLMATDLAFDSRGRARDSESGREFMSKVLKPGPHKFVGVYR